MQRSFTTLAVAACLCSLSGCTLNELFQPANNTAEPLPPAVQAIPENAGYNHPILTEDTADMADTPVNQSAVQPASSDLTDAATINIRGQRAQNVALEDNTPHPALKAPQTTGEGEVFIGSISTPQADFPQTDEPNRPESVGMLLPTYASGFGSGNSCDLHLGQEAKVQAAALTTALTARLKIESGLVYAAPTIIPDEYLDCIGDLSSIISSTAAQQNYLTVISDSTRQNVEQAISQNSGSASTLPLTIRTLRANDIPYLIVSSIRRIGDDAALTLRFVRVSDGITLTQSFKKLLPPETDREGAK